MFDNWILNLTGSGLKLTQILNIPPFIDEELNAVFSKSSVLNQQIVRETLYLHNLFFFRFRRDGGLLTFIHSILLYVAEMQRYYQLNNAKVNKLYWVEWIGISDWGMKISEGSSPEVEEDHGWVKIKIVFRRFCPISSAAHCGGSAKTFFHWFKCFTLLTG